MASAPIQTLSSISSPRTTSDQAPPHLYVVVSAHEPRLTPSRHSLGEVDVVVIGRSQGERCCERRYRDGVTSLVLGLPDPWMSSGNASPPTHARLLKIMGRWVLQDASSRNRTFRNGVPVAKAVLEDGDVFELGRTFFLYRESVPVEPEAPPDGFAPPRHAVPRGMSTLHSALGRQFATLTTMAASSMPVIILGESGTGKELAARAVHALSRRPGPFAAVNCGALTEPLVESLLFGHRKGSFSGAMEDRPGLIRSADQGTLFLDEIGDLPPTCQASLLRVLQEREVLPVGGTRPIPVDIRLCAATHRSLEQLIDQGAFRPDLLARISGFTLRLPPLRERREDLGILLGDILEQRAGSRTGSIGFARETIRVLLERPWPLNIRELERCLEHALLLAGEGPIRVEHLAEAAHVPAGLENPATGATRGPDAEPYPRDELVALLTQHQGNISALSKRLGKQRSQIRRWLHRYGLKAEDFREK